MFYIVTALVTGIKIIFTAIKSFIKITFNRYLINQCMINNITKKSSEKVTNGEDDLKSINSKNLECMEDIIILRYQLESIQST